MLLFKYLKKKSVIETWEKLKQYLLNDKFYLTFFFKWDISINIFEGIEKKNPTKQIFTFDLNNNVFFVKGLLTFNYNYYNIFFTNFFFLLITSSTNTLLIILQYKIIDRKISYSS